MDIIMLDNFPNISSNLDKVSTRYLALENEYYKRLQSLFWEMGCPRDDFFNPIFVWDVLSTDKAEKRLTEIEIKAISQSIMALEAQVGKQLELYGQVKNPIDYDFVDKSLIYRKKRDAIYKYLNSRMNESLFIVSKNRKSDGTFTLLDLDMNIIVPRYTTLPNLANGYYYELDSLFVGIPDDFYKKHR